MAEVWLGQENHPVVQHTNFPPTLGGASDLCDASPQWRGVRGG